MHDRRAVLPRQLERVLAHREPSLMDVLRALVERYSPTGNSAAVQAWIADFLEDLGLEVDVVEAQPDVVDRDQLGPDSGDPEGLARVVTARWRGGDGPRLLLWGHADTEPLREAAHWRYPPTAVTVRGGRAYGLGTADAKAGLVSILMAVAALREAGWKPPGDLVIVSHEGKWPSGLGSLTAVQASGPVSAALYCHPAETGRGLGEIKTSSRGVLHFEICFAGRRPPELEINRLDTADPREGLNALERAARFLEVFLRWARRQDLEANVGVLQGGTHPGVVPEKALLQGMLRFDTGSWRLWLHQISALALQSDNLTPRPVVRPVPPCADPSETPPDDPLVSAVRRMTALLVGHEPSLYTRHVASDIRFPHRLYGAASVGLGPAAGNFYGPDEWVDLESLALTTRVVAAVVAGFPKGAIGLPQSRR